MWFVVVREENLAAVEIEACPVAVEADLGGGLTEIIVEIVALIAGAIEIIEELIVFMGYKASKLELFGVTVAGRVRKSIKVVG